MKKIEIKKRNLDKEIMNWVIALVVLVLIGGVFTYFRFQKYILSADALNSGSNLLAQIQADTDKAAADFNKLNLELKQKNVTITEAMKEVFPAEENYTELARQLDDYFIKNAQGDSNFFLSDLRFGPTRIDPKLDYAELPFTISMNATQRKFEDFLKYIENSGDFTNRTRLIEINSINLNPDSKKKAEDGSVLDTANKLVNV